MVEALLILITALLLVLLILVGLVVLRKPDQLMPADLEQATTILQDNLEKNILPRFFQDFGTAFRDEFSRSRSEYQNYQKNFQDSIITSMQENSRMQREQLSEIYQQIVEMSKMNESRLNRNTDTLEKKMNELVEQNNQKLEKMRETVDEKLQKTLEHRLNHSFNNVNKMLERLQQGLGEMNKLSEGVTDLKKVLSNVKTRGILGEYQLENILEQILSAGQYAKDVQTNSQTAERVEFAIRLPGNKENEEVWIPVDSKFPIEVYQNLLEAYDLNDTERIKSDRKNLESTIKQFARQVKKYINPPKTTDFAVMFIPIEGLYAEIVRNPTLVDVLINQEKILLAGPNNFAAFLSALQVGFRTLSIEKRSAEVWNLLADLKKGFGQFGVLLDKTQKKIQEAGNVISQANSKTKSIERQLRKVEDHSHEQLGVTGKLTFGVMDAVGSAETVSHEDNARNSASLEEQKDYFSEAEKSPEEELPFR